MHAARGGFDGAPGGVPPEVLRAVVLKGDQAGMPEDVRLGVRFARAVLAHDAAADALREEIVRRWGPRALLSLAFAVNAGRSIRRSSTRWATARPASACRWATVPAGGGAGGRHDRRGQPLRAAPDEFLVRARVPHARLGRRGRGRRPGRVPALDAASIAAIAGAARLPGPRGDAALPRSPEVARRAREQYVGTWLPEPVVDEPTPPSSPTISRWRCCSRSSGCRRSSAPRSCSTTSSTCDYAEVGEALERHRGRVPPARRPRARARPRGAAALPRRAKSARTGCAAAFQAALPSGRRDTARVLSEDAVLLHRTAAASARAALNPIHGADGSCGSGSSAHQHARALGGRARADQRPAGVRAARRRGPRDRRARDLATSCDGDLRGPQPGQAAPSLVAPVRHQPGVRPCRSAAAASLAPDVVERAGVPAARCAIARRCGPAPGGRGTP